MRSSAMYRRFETSYISLDDHFAAMQIDLCVRGWIEGLGRNRRLHHSHQFPNYVRSIKRDFTHSLQKNIVYYTPSPPQKQAARKLSLRGEVVQLNESNRKGRLSRRRKALPKKNDSRFDFFFRIFRTGFAIYLTA